MSRFKSKTLNKLRRLLRTLPKSRLNTFVWKIVPLSILSGLLDIGIVALSSRLAGSLVGNDLNDLPAMRFSGYSVAPSDSHPLVLKEADLIINKKGGDGFIRSFIEELIFTKPPSYDQIASFLWDNFKKFK